MPDPVRLHASAVAFNDRGVLIRGASGSGKSSLALHLMALGATLISDDQTELDVAEGIVYMRAPSPIAGLIEARGIGILTADSCIAPLVLVVDLDRAETDRLPHKHSATYFDRKFPCLHKVENAAWPAGILQYLKGDRKEPE